MKLTTNTVAAVNYMDDDNDSNNSKKSNNNNNNNNELFAFSFAFNPRDFYYLGY